MVTSQLLRSTEGGYGRVLGVVLLAGALLGTGCSDSTDNGGAADPATDATTTATTAEPTTTTVPTSTTDGPGEEQHFPDVIDVQVEGGEGSYDFAVTISSPYDTPERYADGWRILGPDGAVYGEHQLTHDHAGEQPFTRTQSGVAIPGDVAEVTVEGRDLVHGYGGETMTVTLPGG